MHKNFPEGFLWGASTSSHQVEGGNYNNWSEWEKRNCRRLSVTAPKRYGSLPEWAKYRSQLIRPDNYVSGIATDSFHHFAEDIELLEEIGCNAYRFSIEWSRIEPRRGEFSKEALDYYRSLIDLLTAKKIEPIVTIWHWTNPIWFEGMGVFVVKDNLNRFYEYAEFLVKSFGQKVNYYIILNEPEVYAQKGYLTADWPPQEKDLGKFFKVIKNLITAHNKIYEIIKSNNRQAKVSSAKHNSYFLPRRPVLLNALPARVEKYIANDYFMNRIAKKCDFVALNHYFTREVGLGKSSLGDLPKSDMGWVLNPAGIYYALMELKKYKLPVIITENGLADSKDQYRAWYISEIVSYMKKAIGSGIDLRGYLHWSLIDNFEWDSGYWPKFGLAEVNRTTLERKLRSSALQYRDIIKKYSII